MGLSAAVIWTFGDLGRATYRTDAIMAAVVLAGLVYFALASWRLNALLSGDAAAKSMGVSVERLRFFSMLAASLITAVCVSFLGMIGFVGIICPHVVKRLLGQDHRVTLPASALAGSILLLLADTFARSVGQGSALPVGAITSLLGAPFFLAILFSRKGGGR
ncbi:MAG: iron ABC transporter permease [Firmicutes bacterium]|nr:iron ABC transporter permease [Bacillota bacterium]